MGAQKIVQNGSSKGSSKWKLKMVAQKVAQNGSSKW